MKTKSKQKQGFATQAIHTGELHECSAMPIYQVSTHADGYTRDDNPTIRALEERITVLEKGTGAVATASGMAAISQTFLALLKTNDHVIAHHTMYYSTFVLLTETLARLGIKTSLVDLRDPDKLRQALKQPTRLVYFEPLVNPSLDVIDVKAVTKLAHKAGVLVMVDNTFLTPYFFRPLETGVDIVVHSATKYLCGHGDALGGVVITRDKKILKLVASQKADHQGGVMSPFNAFLILRGLKTLHLRMDRHAENAHRVAEFLEKHPKLVSVRYPGLRSHPRYKLAKQMFRGFGGMVGPEVKGGIPAAEKLTKSIKLCRNASSLGDVKTLLVRCWTEYMDAERGIPQGYMRMSVGLEDADDIIADLKQALKKV